MVLLCRVVLSAVSGSLTFQLIAFERSATEEVRGVLSDPAHDRLSVVAVDAQFGRAPMLQRHDQVPVIVKRPANAAAPDLAPQLQRRLTAQLDRPTAVEIEFRDTAIADPVENGPSTGNPQAIWRTGPAGTEQSELDSSRGVSNSNPRQMRSLNCPRRVSRLSSCESILSDHTDVAIRSMSVRSRG